MPTIDAATLAHLRRRSKALARVVGTLWDEEAIDWRDLNSCADAIEEITMTVQHHLDDVPPGPKRRGVARYPVPINPTAQDVDRLYCQAVQAEEAEILTREAVRLWRMARAPKALDRARHLLKSAGGAVRNAHRRHREAQRKHKEQGS